MLHKCGSSVLATENQVSLTKNPFYSKFSVLHWRIQKRRSGPRDSFDSNLLPSFLLLFLTKPKKNVKHFIKQKMGITKFY